MLRETSTELKLYIAGAIVFFCLSILLLKSSPEFPLWALPLSLLGIAFFVAGFLLWLLPKARTLWATRRGRWLVWLVHAAIVFIAVIPARELVAHALGLPPSDFDLSVTFWSIVFIVPIWLVLVSLLMAVICLAFVGKFLRMVVIGPAFVGKSWLLASGRGRSDLLATFRGFGAFLFFFLCLFGLSRYTSIIPYLEQPVRWFAFVAEYQSFSAYPNIEPTDARVKLHENGVVSYAERNDSRISIRVGKLAP